MISVKDISGIVGGKVIGDGKVMVKGIAMASIAGEGDLTFAMDEAGLKDAAESRAACVLTTAETGDFPKTILQVRDMKLAMTVIYNALLETRPPEEGKIHPSAVVYDSVSIGRSVSIGPNAVIGEASGIGDNSSVGAGCVIGKNVLIGHGTRLYPNVTIYDNTVIGNGVGIHAGAVIGADGFGYMPKDGKIYKVPQMGNVVIEDNVEIGANTCVDRGTFSTTVIGAGTKIDNNVQIAHNVRLGRNVIIAAQTGIAGSTVVGENTMIGGMVGIADHVTIGRNVKIGAKTGVTGNLRDNEVVFGYPHRAAAEARKLHGLLSVLMKYSGRLRKFLRTLPED